MNTKRSDSNRPWTAKRILSSVVVIVIALLYAYYQQNQPAGSPSNESTSNSSARQTVEASNPSTANAESGQQDAPFLQPGSNHSLRSPAGLVYTQSRSGHRVDHVLRHATDDPDRPGPHGVFDAQGDDVFRLLDEAYELIQQDSPQVDVLPPEDFKRPYIVDLQRRVGFLGGQSGQQRGHPELRRIKMILAENRVITAFPY